ncbi:DegT/DnrJ/EryC1/StrS aminotransferase [Legionella taurinensis]|uniref:Aminotransferase class I/II-fold pyridoxal phosphate-dependent enzyme n=1 Tax=Legionella taurinensis TaxID=70611 RepID=A0A3A5L1M1_9GAMM|nr:DegT/DnrJ/EryC1/StrS family aminotransferase [Legionella taurinensis]MDX1837243.1 aminotransferase class I/II-fold pyridoxal phosphate-dependent enzyme [Legionella taurinensis]PUT40284.1 DegT/DnrJ/EryC1/StrS aminotransferase [Legionella taurinensis]PUT41518.1 DegT/DnrJ/EryC1/StrS aminotransferase [Legionella taurinensis]PUT44384.1 DegT/DnrJ/EryC1/StrS aminotransferase [Legionella taurinensis]PUT48346.1 DegT/DnrJ/EryC1/StrS aminotransferase [Legionella taurinensis]
MQSNAIEMDQLAMDGGEPVRRKPWPTYDKGHVVLDEEDAQSLIDVMQSKRLFRYDNRCLNDTKVGQFESELKQYFNTDYALAVSSGTAALSLPLMALQLPDNALVGCPAYSFTATPSAIIQAKLKPLLIEVDANLHMDLADLEKKLPQLKALIVVHMRGFPAPLPAIKAMADRYGVPIIEDAVPSLGCKLRDKFLGTYGLAGAFSTQSDKSLNTGEGGFILTNDKALYLNCVIMSGAYECLYEKHCANEAAIDFTRLPVFNFRLDELRGALGLSQLKKLTARLDRLSKNYCHILERIQDLAYVKPRAGWDETVMPIGDNLLLKMKGTIDDCCWFAEALCAEGIDAKALGDCRKVNVRRFWDWAYLFDTSCRETIKSRHAASAEHISSYIDIALSPTLIDEDIDDFCTALRKVHHHYEQRKAVTA